MDFTDHGAEQTLRWVLGQTPGTPPLALFVKLHIGDPGADGTDNPAANTERQPTSLGPVASPGATPDGSAIAISDATSTWSDVPATEIYSHVSLWDSSTVGDAWYKVALVSPIPVVAGADFELLAGNGIVGHR